MIRDSITEIATVKARISTFRSVRDNFKSELVKYISKRDSTVVQDTTELNQRKSVLERTLASLKLIRKEMDKYHAQIHVLEAEKSEIQRNLSLVRHKNKEITAAITHRKRDLAISLEGVCPRCHQRLHDEDVVTTLSVEIESLKSQLPDPRLEVNLEKQCIEKQTTRIILEQDLAELKNKIGIVDSIEAQLVSVNSELAYATQQADYGPAIETLTASFEKHEKEIAQDEILLEALLNRQEAMDWIHKLLKRNGPLISALAKQGQKLLQDQVDILTDDASFKVIIEDDLSISAMFLGRQPGDYNQLSTGQARVVDIVLMVALNNLFTQLYALEHGVLGLVIFDEVLSFLDPVYSDFCFGLINRVNVPKKVVITHDKNLISKFDNEINVFLEGESSSVYTKNWA
jgi:chromosome segregation ATPase